MSAINSPGACLSLDNKVVLGGISHLLLFGSLGKYETDSALVRMCYQEY